MSNTATATHSCSKCGKEMTAEAVELRKELLGVDTCPACTDLGPMPVLEDSLDLRSGEIDVELPDDGGE